MEEETRRTSSKAVNRQRFKGCNPTLITGFPNHRFEVCMFRNDIPVELRVIVKSYLSRPLTDVTIHNAVKNYVTGSAEEKHQVQVLFGLISQWDTSQVTDMSFLFASSRLFPPATAGKANSFNEDLSAWDVSKVRSMRAMFNGCVAFNQPFNEWNTSQVADMREMFVGAKSFNQPLAKWNTSSIQYIEKMFAGAKSFNQPLDSWVMENVESFNFMFQDCRAFNQPLNAWAIGSNKMKQKIISVVGMFRDCVSFNQPLDAWNTSTVTDMSLLVSKGCSIQPAPGWMGHWEGNVHGVHV